MRARLSFRSPLLFLLLVVVNACVAHRLFTLEYSAWRGSIEGTFIAITRIYAAHPAEHLWWPFWSAGLPFQNVYFPLLQVIAAVFSKIGGWSAARSWHLACASFYCLGPATVFIFACTISRRRMTSFVAALLYSLWSPSALLVPDIRADIGGLWKARRLHLLTFYGEGPHLAAVTLLPLAILFLYLSIERHRRRDYILAGVLCASVVATNAFGAIDLVLAAACLLCTVNIREFRRNARVIAIIGVISYLWISPVVPPSLLKAIRMNAPFVGGYYSFSVRAVSGMALLAGGTAALWLITLHDKAPVHLRFILLFAFLVSGIVLLSSAFGLAVIPQPHRYQVEMEMAICLASVFGGEVLIERLPRPVRWVALAAVLVFCCRQGVVYARFARLLIRPIDITRTFEYRLPRWIDSHMPGERIMVSGAPSFWFNIFSDTPQLFGEHAQLDPNWAHEIAMFIIYTGLNAGAKDAEISLLWLKAFGAHAVTAPDPAGAGPNRLFQHPDKFEGVLPVLWRDNGNIVYRVPARTESLAHVVPLSAIVRRTPSDGLDIGSLAPYVAALDNPALPEAECVWRGYHAAGIHTTAQPGQALSVQITYHPGWHATVNGVARRVFQDGLGLLALDPGCHGPCAIELEYDGGPEWRITTALSGLITLAVVIWLLGTAPKATAFRSRFPAISGKARLPRP